MSLNNTPTLQMSQLNEEIKLKPVKVALTKEQILRKVFLKYGCDDADVDIIIHQFQMYIEKNLKVDYQNWILGNPVQNIDKYIGYYLTH